jgi:hypothetical protein
MKQLQKMTGLGDLVEAATTVTGVKAATEAVAKVTGKDCGCKQRRDKLNRLFPFRRDADGVQPDKT